MKLKNRSCKSKEKFADSMMAIANSIHIAVLISVFVFPLTAFLTAIFGNNEQFSFVAIIHRMTWSNIWIFAFAYLGPIWIGVVARTKAMNLYDEVARSATELTGHSS